MATIPIEVIVQDAEAPVVPSEDGTNNTETNIIVPDTGTISNNGETNSSASSIILPAILLVLAIGSIVAILIHKYHKQKQDKNSKKEKLATAAASTIAILTTTVLVSNLILPATKAATSNTADGVTPAEDKVSIVVTRDGGSAEESIESTATITSTSDFGYKVLLFMVEGAETNNLYLDGNVDSDYYISATESTELSDNTWGYTLEEDGEYAAVPLVDNAVTITQGDGLVEDAEMNIYYGVKVSSDLPAGTYSGGEIEYTLTDNGFPSSLTTMQGMTSEICESIYTPNAFKADGATIEDNVPTATLTDIRDNKTYTVAKLADGKCWMTQNLDLQKEDLLTDITLNNTNTDHPAEDFMLPNSQTEGNESWGNHSSEATVINTPHIYDISADGQNYHYCIEYEEQYGNVTCKTYDEEIIPSKDLGNYYNWYSATAGTGKYGPGSSTVATGSICPAGWRLPDGSSQGISNDYSILLYKYGVLNSPTSPNPYNREQLVKTFDAPLSLKRIGYYASGISSIGMSGNIWSSRVGFQTSVYSVEFGYYLNIWAGSEMFGGGSVRCLAQ